MNAYLEIDSTQNTKLIFKFTFINPEYNDVVLAVSELESTIDSVGLKITKNKERVESVKYMMINLSDPRSGDVILKNGEQYEISIDADIEYTNNLGYILKLKHATYLLDVGATYHINLSWRGLVSNIVKWSFNPS